MVTADQLIAHAVGDYLLQSDWMANEKTKRSVAAVAHVATYFLPFLFLTRAPAALAFIIGTHFVIDRWRLARYVCWAKNWLAPFDIDSGSAVGFPARQARRNLRRVGGPGGYRMALYTAAPPWSRCTATGYDAERPPWMTVWLMIVADNVMHVLCNAAALRWLT